MTQLSNQFNQTVEKGMLSGNLNVNTIPVKIDPAQVTALVPGQPVMLSDVAGDGIVVKSLTNDTAEIFGYVPFSRGKVSFVANEVLEIASTLDIIYLEAGAAIARGAQVMPVITGNKVITATTGKSIAGIALDKPAADGELFRVALKLYGSKAL